MWEIKHPDLRLYRKLQPIEIQPYEERGSQSVQLSGSESEWKGFLQRANHEDLP